MTKTLAVVWFALVILSWSAQAAESDAPRPWLKGTTTFDQVAGIHTVRAEANVEVSDGHDFAITVLYPDHEAPRQATFKDRACRVVTTGEDDPVGGPIGMRMHHGPEMRRLIN